MKIGEIAQRVGVSVSALRLYEQRGLIVASRSPGGTRHYSEDELDRFLAIVGLTRAEVSIEDLTRLARVRSEHVSGDAASRKVESILSEVETGLLARLDQIQTVLADLREAKHHLAGCHDCPHRPTRANCANCPVAVDLLKCVVMRLVWDQAKDDAPKP